MSIPVNIPDELADTLRSWAQADGVSVEECAGRLLERTLRGMKEWRAFQESSRDLLKDSGMTEDEAVELFEKEKHAMRAEKRRKAS